MAANQSQRPKFYEEQYLGAADLTAAVDYGRVRQARHALGAHTWGIAIGLQLKETPQAGGAVSVHLLPGYAWDGYGRPIVVLSPYKIPEEKFSAIKFDAAIDTGDGEKGRLIPVWLRYDESATQNPRPGFEVCETADQRSRIQETFRIEIGEPGTTDRYTRVTVGTKSLIDAKTALQAFDPTAPLVYDESIPQQTFPESQDRARWLIPIGHVRWLPVEKQPGHFVARDDGSADKDSDKIRRFRRYIGVVTEEIAAADGAIRLRDRGKDPAKSSFQWPTQEQMTKDINDLVWVEGHLRVVGNTKLCGGKLDFCDPQGNNHDVPLAVQRIGDGSPGGRALQMVIGPDTQPNNRLAVGPLKNGSVDEKFAVLSNGNVGIGTSNPTQMLTFSAPEGNRLEIGRTSTTLPWSPANPARPGAFVINQQSQGASGAGTGADFALMRDGKKRLTLLDTDTNLSSQGGGSLRFFVNYDEPSGSQEALTITGAGNVGIGTTNPTHKFHVLAQEAVGLFESTTATQAYLRLTTSEGLNNRVEITNRQGGRLSLFTPGAGDAFNITRDGNVGIGTTTPTLKLDVQGDLGRENGPATLHLWGASIGDTGDARLFVRAFHDGVVAFDGISNRVGIGTPNPQFLLHVNGNAAKPGGGSWSDIASDARLKKNIEPLTGALSRLLRLRGVRFEWIDPEEMGNLTGPQLGFVAQEVEAVFPEWVSISRNGYQSLTIRGFEALTIEALRELQREMESLRTRLEAADGKQPVASTRPRGKRG